MINYLFEGIDEFVFDGVVTTDWISSSIKEEGKLLGEVVYHFCSDKELLAINKTFLNHDTFTDIISFPTSNNQNVISGEIYISIDRVRENSKQFNVSFNKELHRVLIHGILHFIGYNDHDSSEKIEMRSKEDYYLNLHPQF